MGWGGGGVEKNRIKFFLIRRRRRNKKGEAIRHEWKLYNTIRYYVIYILYEIIEYMIISI